MLEFNIAPNTQIGKIEIPDKVWDNENYYNQDKYQRSGEFIENLVTDNIIEFCKRWLHLAGFKELLEDYNEYHSKFITSYSSSNAYGEYNTNQGSLLRVPILDNKNKSKEALVFNEFIDRKPFHVFSNLEQNGVDTNELRSNTERLLNKYN